MKRALSCALLILSAALSSKSYAGSILMGTGTEWGNWKGQLSISGSGVSRPLYQILKDSQIPTRLEKTYLNDTYDMTHTQELLDNGVCPVWLEENEIEGIYAAEYPTGNAWDPTHVWNANIQAAADAYLANVIVPRIEQLKKVRFNGLKIYYVLNPEFTFVGDCKTGTGYSTFVNKQIDMLRAAQLPGLVIVRGFLVVPGDFNSYLGTIQNWANANRTQLSKVDYFGPEFHNQLQVGGTTAASMIGFLTTVRSYTGKLNFIPNSYIYYSIYYEGSDAPPQQCGSDADAAAFWDYLRVNRDQLESVAGVAGWCLSATMEARGGSGLVEPQRRPSPFAGYVYPFGVNNTYNQAGIAFANWMRSETPYVIANKQSGMDMDVEGGSLASGAKIVQVTPNRTTGQKWTLVQIDNGYYTIKNKQSGLWCATTSGSSGALIQQIADSGGTATQWLFSDAGNGFCKIQNRQSGLLLSVVGASPTSGARLEQRADDGGDSQLWELDYQPAVPSGLAALAFNKSVKLNWAAGATGYNLKRSLNSGGPYTTIAANTTGTSYNDASVNNGMTYYYVLSASNAYGESADSTETSAQPSRAIEPVADTFARDGSYADTNYGTSAQLTAKADITGFNRDAFLRFNVGSLGNTQSVKLRLVPESGASEIGATQLSYEFVASDSWSETGLTWNNKPSGSGTVFASVLGYSVGAPVEIDVTSQALAGAASDGWLSVRISSVIAGSNRLVSFASREHANTSYHPVLEYLLSPPPVPSGLTATPGGAQISLNWTASPGASSYNVKRATTSGDPFSTIASGVASASFTDTGLNQQTTYYYVVSALNSENESGNSAQIGITPAQTFTQWVAATFPGQSDPAIVGPNADPDRDGLPNLLEFALGLNPSAASVASASLVRNGATLEYTCLRNDSAIGAVSFIVEWRDSLAPGSWSTAGVTQGMIPNSDNGATQQWKATVPAGPGPKRFIRLRVTQP